MVVAQFRFISFEHRTHDLEPLLEKKVQPWRYLGVIALIVYEVELSKTCFLRNLACFLGRRFLYPL